MQARLKDGSTVTLEKDCECQTHEGPHWLHMDSLHREMNQDFLKKAQAGNSLAAMGFAQEEQARLSEKLWAMESRGIAEILR
jgi:hypothetical protein